ncbi:MAG TPA: hypothetical protein VF957_22285, partial [Bradyrhizobium sp.]
MNSPDFAVIIAAIARWRPSYIELRANAAAPTENGWVGYGAGCWTNRGDSYGAITPPARSDINIIIPPERA